MELALTLGDSSKQLLFLEKNPSNDLGFGMALGTREGYDKKDDVTCRQKTTRDSSSDPPVQLNLLPSAPVIKTQLHLPWLSHKLAVTSEAASLYVNRFALGNADELCSPNSVVASFQMDFGFMRSKRGLENLEVLENERASSIASDDDENGSSTRKKLRLSKDQSAFLEESFKEHSTLNPKQKIALAKQLNLRPRQVEVWFQNRRARTKLKQTEVDCEYLKRCCETLTEENKRLQKELQELRALKSSQHFNMQLPATTLSMCPSCERVVTTATTTIPINKPCSPPSSLKSKQ